MTRPVIWPLLVDYRPVIPRPAVGLSRRAWRTACQAAGVPTRFLHDCRRIAARTLIRASVPERVTMLLTGHKTRAIFDCDNIIHEQELLEAGDQLVAYLEQHAQAAGGPTGFLQRLPPHRRPQPDPRGICHEIVAGVGPSGVRRRSQETTDERPLNG